MIPILGALPPETFMPFGPLSGPSVSGAGSVNVTLPSWVRNVGRYNLLTSVRGSWGGSAEHAGIEVLDQTGSPIISAVEGYSIAGSFLTASEGQFDGSTWIEVDPTTRWWGGSIGNVLTYFLFEGITGAATVRLNSVAGNIRNPTYFGPWSVTGFGRGRRDPPNWAALKAAMTTSGDGYLRIICS